MTFHDVHLLRTCTALPTRTLQPIGSNAPLLTSWTVAFELPLCLPAYVLVCCLVRFLFMALEGESDGDGPSPDMAAGVGLGLGVGGDKEGGGLSAAIKNLFAGRLMSYVEVSIG